eukprot:1188534-Prorocentrum_minimum.AAC.2
MSTGGSRIRALRRRSRYNTACRLDRGRRESIRSARATFLSTIGSTCPGASCPPPPPAGPPAGRCPPRTPPPSSSSSGGRGRHTLPATPGTPAHKRATGEAGEWRATGGVNGGLQEGRIEGHRRGELRATGRAN